MDEEEYNAMLVEDCEIRAMVDVLMENEAKLKNWPLNPCRMEQALYYAFAHGYADAVGGFEGYKKIQKEDPEYWREVVRWDYERGRQLDAAVEREMERTDPEYRAKKESQRKKKEEEKWRIRRASAVSDDDARREAQEIDFTAREGCGFYEGGRAERDGQNPNESGVVAADSSRIEDNEELE